MTKKDNLFLRLLRFALHTGSTCPSMCLRDWQAMYRMAKKQTLTALIGKALEGIDSNVLLDSDEKAKEGFGILMMQWMGEVVKATRRNLKINGDVIEEVRLLEDKGLECCLLKGQGNALIYPHPEVRMAGDIDMWVRLKGTDNDDRNIRKIIKGVKEVLPDARATYHHIDAPDTNGTPVELHYRPQFLFSHHHNKRLQRFFVENADEQFAHKVRFGDVAIAVPTARFNIVFQLSHIYNHLFHEGIGLRQVVDYYYCLSDLSRNLHGRQEEDVISVKEGNGMHRDEALERLLRRLGLYQIAGSIMWILITQLGMDGRLAIVNPDEKRGSLVLNEILQGGNFGKSDNRYHFGNSALGKNLQRLQRDCRLVRYFPSEAVSEPFFRLWHAGWRMCHN